MVRRLVVLAGCAVALCVSTAGAKIGIGLHWGNDFSMSMEDTPEEQAVFDGVELDIGAISGTNPGGFGATVTGEDLPIYISRTDWTRKPLNIGGKLFVDIFPLIDAVEISGNFGIWEYQGTIMYPTGIDFTNENPLTASSSKDLFAVTYDTLDLTLDEFGMDYVGGLTGTPYAKLNLDLTIRKYLVQLPKTLKVLRLYGGAGASVHFATPMLSAGLIEDALGEDLANTFQSVDALGTNVLGNTDVMDKVVKEIIAGLAVPKWGMHIDLGGMVKIPVVPFFVYADGKFMIPFGQMDPNVKELTGAGLLLNLGVGLYF